MTKEATKDGQKASYKCSLSLKKEQVLIDDVSDEDFASLDDEEEKLSEGAEKVLTLYMRLPRVSLIRNTHDQLASAFLSDSDSDGEIDSLPLVRKSQTSTCF